MPVKRRERVCLIARNLETGSIILPAVVVDQILEYIYRTLSLPYNFEGYQNPFH